MSVTEIGHVIEHFHRRQNSPNNFSLSKWDIFASVTNTWPNRCRNAKMSQKWDILAFLHRFGHVQVADAKMSQFKWENINETFWHRWKCSITWPISVTVVLGYFGNHGVMEWNFSIWIWFGSGKCNGCIVLSEQAIVPTRTQTETKCEINGSKNCPVYCRGMRFL